MFIIYMVCCLGCDLRGDLSRASLQVLEAVSVPVLEEATRVMRVRCMSMSDALSGWVTVAGNQGTCFLEPGGNLYSCVRDTEINEEVELESPVIRRLMKGEVVEVLEFSDKRRIKGKAKQDGAVGFISLQAQGAVLLEPC